MSKKKKIINFIILFIAVALVLFFTLKDDFKDIIYEISNINIWIYILVILIFLISHFFKSLGLYTFLNEYKKYTIKNSYELTLISLFLNGVTPFQTGGQPFQIYLLRKGGMRVTDSTNAMIKDSIAYQIALLLVAILALLFNIKLDVCEHSKYLILAVLFGFIINSVVLFLLLFVICAKKTGYKILNNLINFIFKFKITKKYVSSKEKLKESLNYFYENRNSIANNKKNFIIGTMFHIIHLITLYFLPVLIFKSMGVKIGILTSFTCVAFVMLIGNFIPIPGATGGIEYGFLQFFGKYVTGALLSSGMLLWRFATYFFGLIVGSIILLFKREDNKK